MAMDGSFAMAAAIKLREDFSGASLRRLAKLSKDANQTRRLLALAVIYDGGKRGERMHQSGQGLVFRLDLLGDGRQGLVLLPLQARRRDVPTASTAASSVTGCVSVRNPRSRLADGPMRLVK